MPNGQPNQNNPNQQPLFPQPPQKRSVLQWASAFADFVRAALTIVAWLTIGSIGLGVAYICIRAVLYAVKLAEVALYGRG